MKPFAARIMFTLFTLSLLSACATKNLGSGTTSLLPLYRLDVILKYSPTVESSLYACVLDAVRQGLSSKQALTQCEIQLVSDFNRGFDTDVPGGFAGRVDAFDPAAVVSSCSQTDIRYASDGPRTPSGSIPWTTIDPKATMVFAGEKVGKYGDFSYGGDSTTVVTAEGHPYSEAHDGDKAYVYKGLTEEQAIAEKRALVEKAERAEAAFLAAQSDAFADPKNEEKQKKSVQAFDAWLDAAHEASEDPNLTPWSSVRTAPESLCETTLDFARELLRECNRNGWKSAECQVLHAKMNKCPDPTKILVDPEVGYVCVETVDPQAVIAAWQARCRQIATPGPDGRDPCGPIEATPVGYIRRSGSSDICQDPRAFVDPSGGECIRTLAIDSFGQPNIKNVIQFGLGHFGGPIFVVPTQTPPPKIRGTDPRPGPR